MRHPLNMILFGVLTWLMASCTQEEATRQGAANEKDGPVISFLAAADNATRSVVTGESLDASETFRIYAVNVLRDGEQPKDDATPSVMINGNVVSYQRVNAQLKEGYMYVWKTDNDYLWPQDIFLVTFYAIYPSSAPRISNILTDKSFSYTEGTQLIDGQQDLMYAQLATHRDDVVNTEEIVSVIAENRAAKLDFHHALARLQFFGKLSPLFVDFGWTVEVGGITIHNVNAAGTFDFDAAGGPAITPAATPVLRNYEVTMNPNRQPVTTAAVATDDDNTLIPLSAPTESPMLIPQNLTAWNPATEHTIAATTGSYLEVKLRIRDNSGYYHLGSADTYTTVYTPFTTGVQATPGGSFVSWSAAKTYNYTLEFGGGYDGTGQSVLQTISLTCAIEPWSSTEDVNGEAKHQRRE